MMSGATGVAYQCLRLARMRQVPSVLCGTSRLLTGAAGASDVDGAAARRAQTQACTG
jgi:hypothetical protein